MADSRSFHPEWCVILFYVIFLSGQLSAQAAANPQQNHASAPNGADPVPQLKLPVPLVVEDVVVLDHEDRPVHGLKAADFVVLEDGKPVVVRNFTENTAAPTPATPVKPLDLGPNRFTNLPQVDPSSSLNILLLDALNTPFEDQPRVRQQMLSYLKELSPTTRIAVFGLATHLYLLQGFTSDPAMLRAAIEQRRGAGFSPLLDDPVLGGPGTAMADTMSGAPLSGSVLASVQEFEAEQETANLQRRMIQTLVAMNQLARYLAALPGRKNLIWFSGSFPLNVLPDPDLPNPFAAVDDFRDDVRQTAELFARSRVAVYPVDARGLLSNPALSVTHVGPPPAGASGKVTSTTIANATIAANHKFFTQTSAEYATMNLIAKETGGKAFYMTNDLKQAVEKAIDYGENYYTLSYTPDNQKWDGSFRKVVIRTNQPDLHLAYRPGYFADQPDAPSPWGQKVLPADPMQTAMLRGGPDATQVVFEAGLIPEAKPSSQLNPGAHPEDKRMRPPYRSYTVRVLVDIRSVTMTLDSQGAHHGAVELVVAVYDGNGARVNSTMKEAAIDVPPDRYAEALANGAGTHVDIDVPANGEYFLRIGIQDLAGNRVGALEVPVSALESYDQLNAGGAPKVRTELVK
jgi:VWFA-related protein